MVNALLLNFHGLSDIHYQKKCFAPILWSQTINTTLLSKEQHICKGKIKNESRIGKLKL